MYASTWLQSLLLPRKWDVCGIITRPLSLWHVYILQKTGNPYLCGGVTTIDAAAEVLIYASCGLKEGRDLYWKPAFRSKQRKKIHAKLKRLKQEQVNPAINEYVSACVFAPEHKEKVSDNWQKEIPQKPIPVPASWIYAQHLICQCGKSLEDAFDTPFCEAACLFTAYRATIGEDVNLLSEEDCERLDRKIEEAKKIKGE